MQLSFIISEEKVYYIKLPKVYAIMIQEVWSSILNKNDKRLINFNDIQQSFKFILANLHKRKNQGLLKGLTFINVTLKIPIFARKKL